MPTIGWFEILIVVAIAIVVLGPKDFPIMGTQVMADMAALSAMKVNPDKSDPHLRHSMNTFAGIMFLIIFYGFCVYLMLG